MPGAIERTPLDLRPYALQPQQVPFTPHGALTALDRRDALVGGAMVSGTLVVSAAAVLCPALSWWALAGLAGGSAGVTAAVQTGVARRARHVPQADVSFWPLSIQRKAMLETLHKLHTQRPANPARNALFERLGQRAATASDYAAFLRALGPLGSAADTHEVLKCMRWHALHDWIKGRRGPAATAEPSTEAEAADQALAEATAARAKVLWQELERLAMRDAMHLLHDEEGQLAWIEARLAFVLHRGLLPRLLEGSPVLDTHPEWFRWEPSTHLRERHVADFISYWQQTPALHDRFIEAALNPAWL